MNALVVVAALALAADTDELMIGQPLPLLDLPTLEGARAEIGGKPTVILFAATWCPASKELGPLFEKLAAARADARFLMVDIDEDAAKVAATWRDKKKLTIPIALDAGGAFTRKLLPPPGLVARAKGPDNMTAQFVVVDKDGVIRHWRYAMNPGPSTFARMVAALDAVTARGTATAKP